MPQLIAEPSTGSLSTTVSVALATDDNYIAPTLVAVGAMAAHASVGNRYSIYILSERTLGRASRSLFRSAVRQYPNVSVSFIAVGDRLGSVNLSDSGPIKGVSRATYFRFLLPELLCDIDKILYIDADTVALDDVARIYSYDIGDMYIGGVRDICGYQDIESRCRELSIDSLDEYVNAGVLLMNLKRLREDGLPERMMAAATARTYPYNDQDIINSLCYGGICPLPHSCNVIVDYLDDPSEISQALGIDYLGETAAPIILHYAGRAKPWYHRDMEICSHWWQVAGSIRGASALIFRYYMNKLLNKACKKHAKSKKRG